MKFPRFWDLNFDPFDHGEIFDTHTFWGNVRAIIALAIVHYIAWRSNEHSLVHGDPAHFKQIELYRKIYSILFPVAYFAFTLRCITTLIGEHHVRALFERLHARFLAKPRVYAPPAPPNKIRVWLDTTIPGRILKGGHEGGRFLRGASGICMTACMSNNRRFGQQV